jgi:hypothetical protein
MPEGLGRFGMKDWAALEMRRRKLMVGTNTRGSRSPPNCWKGDESGARRELLSLSRTSQLRVGGLQ